MMKRQAIPVLLLTMLLILPPTTTASVPDAAPPQPEGWVTLVSEGFEGEFPSGLWHIGRTGDPYLWGQRACNPHQGSYSMWGGGGGTQGAQIPCTGMYTTGFATTLSYGPFDLSDCTDLRVNFAHWTWLGAGDSLGVGFSIDGGKVWHLQTIIGNAVSVCGGWCEESFYQNRWSIPLCGQPNVYLLFRFASNAEGVSYGTFVDDVSLEASFEGAPLTATRTPTPTATPAVTRTPTPTRTPAASPTATHTATVGPAARRVYLPRVLR